nr:serine protease 40 [Castor canadensis]
MGGSSAQQPGRGGRGACVLASFLLWLHLEPTKSTPSLSEVCGKTRFHGKIFGGQKAEPERWPWQASLLLRGSHICGAALIDKAWVLSAAHCFQRSRNPSDYRILLGYNQLSKPTSYSRIMTVNKLIVHPDYDKYHRQGSDIVLLQLHVPVEFNSHVLPACVPDNNTKFTLEKPCWISGWGMITEDKFLPQPFQLQEAEVFLIENQICSAFFQPPEPGVSGQYAVKDDMVCAGTVETEKSICRGDSGGPLVCPVNGSWYLAGLSSWSVECQHPIASPSVFSRVSYFFNWIQENKATSPDPDPNLAPPQENPPALKGSHNQGSVLKPSICMALLSSQTLLLLLLLRIL